MSHSSIDNPLSGGFSIVNSTNSCSLPLLDQSNFDVTGGGGYRNGRYCGAGAFDEGPSCCFPCPIQDWVYPPEWRHQLRVPNYLSILSVILCSFLLLSFAVLPPSTTNRHYLSVGLLLSVLLISLSFIIPISTDPGLCYDAITPNDMRTSLSCAWTGALVTLGGLGCVIWVLLRSLWLHVRIVWDVTPGRQFQWGSIAAGTLLPFVYLIATLAGTGFSYRLGQTCLPNHENAIVVFWAWLISFAVAGFLLQTITTGYCIWTYLRSLRRERNRQSFHQQSTFQIGSERLETWRHVRKLFLLQWRDILISSLVLAGSIVFFIVFWRQDTKLGRVDSSEKNMMAIGAWIACQTSSLGDKDECRKYLKGLTVSLTSVLTSLILASLVGIEIFILMFRLSMLHAWLNLFKSFSHRTHLVRPPSPTLTTLAEPDRLHPRPPDKHLPIESSFSASAPSRSSDETAESSIAMSPRTTDSEQDHVPRPATRSSYYTERVTSFFHDSSAEASRSNTPTPSSSGFQRKPTPPLRSNDSFIPQRNAPTPPIMIPPRAYRHFSSPSPTRSRHSLHTPSSASPHSVTATSPSPGLSLKRTNSSKLAPGSRPRPTISSPVMGSFKHVDGAFVGEEWRGRRKLSTVGDVEMDREDGV